MTRFLIKLRNTVAQALDHDVINTAKAAAYSGMLMLFPALLVITTLLAQVPEGNTLVGELRATFRAVSARRHHGPAAVLRADRRIHSAR
jgi:membrane protein